MRDILFSIAVVLFIWYFMPSCANPGMITGGPKDTIPPKLVFAEPQHKSVNFKGQEFLLVFDEKINTDKLKGKLIITPFIDNKFKVKSKKNEVELIFDDPFPDSTTYILNFADGIGDLNENNPAVNLKIAFSTTSYIDSLQITGKVRNLLSNEPRKKYLVSLYSSDTASVFKHKPTYFTYTDDNGNFLLENLKVGKYRLYTFDDDNKNLLLEADKEALGFLPDTIKLRRNIDSLQLKTQVINGTPVKMQRAGTAGPYFEIRYTKHIQKYTLEKINEDDPLLNSILADKNQVVRFYNDNKNYKDSTGYYVTAYDSIGNYRLDTVYAKFTEFKRALPEFEMKINPEKSANIIDSIAIRLESNKPLRVYDVTKLNIISADTIIPIKIHLTDSFSIDYPYNLINIKLPNYSQNIQQWKEEQLTALLADSLTYTDSAAYFGSINTIKKINKDKYTIEFPKGMLISIENDTLPERNISLTVPPSDQFGKVSGNIVTRSEFYIVELIDKSFKTIRSIKNPGKTYVFDNLKQGTYSIRVRIGNEETKNWSYGNIQKNIGPDRVYFLDKTFDIRPNWELENIDLVF